MGFVFVFWTSDGLSPGAANVVPVAGSLVEAAIGQSLLPMFDHAAFRADLVVVWFVG